MNEISESEINQEAEKAYREVVSKSKISTNPEWTKIVERVSARIAKASGEPFNWEVVLIESPEVNAWCMPGGKMAVYTGIMPVLKTEAALAAVMGHEVAHATLRHGKQQYARNKTGSLAGAILGAGAVIGGQILCKTKSCINLTMLGGVASGFAITFFERKFSREDETSADHEGQILMAKAGYDPSEASKLWERMNEKSGGNNSSDFYSTHPSDQKRKKNLNQWLTDAQKHYEQSPNKYGLGDKI